MKKIRSCILLLGALLFCTACAGKDEAPKMLDKEGIAPYELTEGENYVLQSFNMEDTSQMIVFHAPKEATTLNVNVYRLEGESWRSIGGGGISIGADRKPTDQLSGAFTMQLQENYAIDFAINSSGLASYQTDEIFPDVEIMASTKAFLQEFQEIEINAEIPVAMMIYDGGTKMRSYSLQDYFEPSLFEGMDLVQAVTLEFVAE